MHSLKDVQCTHSQYSGPSCNSSSPQDDQFLPPHLHQIEHLSSPGEVQEKLVFRSVQFEDIGVYECRASNLAGTSRHEFSLAVTGLNSQWKSFELVSRLEI